MKRIRRLTPPADWGLALGAEHRVALGLAIGIALGIAGAAGACNVPVFRFALERWRADPYRIVVFHRGPPGDAERDLLRALEEQSDRLPVNASVRTVDVDGLDADDSPAAAADRGFLSHLHGAQFPCVVVQYPAHLQIAAPPWIGPLSHEALAQVIDSPARREIVRRLAAGETAVWILLESGDATQDDRAAELLTAELKKLEQTLELPVLTGSPDDALTTQLPLEVKFSLLRAGRGSIEEKMLAAMLLGSEPDLAELSEPIVFPVFGRGRVLLPLVGVGISAKNIGEVAEFLAGACSCEVKEQSPGFDLLLAADWERLLPPSTAPLSAAIALAANAPAGEPAVAELVPIPQGSARSSAVAANASPLGQPHTLAKAVYSAGFFGILASGLAIAGALTVALAAAAMLRRRFT